ncbi:stress responsive A/B barrel domain protein [Daldinia caldariorum]|uniref:stress responsive A/B barrel domain protein n=1 Tax=Daldinia caldariorum TaxID=326644 RepID=UPI0020076701|nr:stress responsive A/B barrel domain protein [Daldinia caldariorum]KAI1468327.1 stress responsive A/B barrel domain protein [Daldinia caldariorum]
MGIFHVVLFKFKALVTPEEIKAACVRMLALGSNCIHPTSKKPYVKVHGGGRDNSPEGKQLGMTHIFIFEFDSEEDREYYLYKDPAHAEFVTSIKDLVEEIQSLDFIPGEF